MTMNKETKIQILIALLLAAALISVPISSNKDLYITTTVEFPATSSHPKIYTMEALAKPHTIIESPYFLAGILTSGPLKLIANSSTKTSQTSMPVVYRGFTSDGYIVLRDIPPTEDIITVTLYEDGNQIDSQRIVVLNE